MSIQSYPINDVRKLFPALKRTYKDKTVAYFDGPGGSQVVGTAIEAIADYMKNGGANVHQPFASSIETDKYIIDGKKAIADLVNCKWEEVAYGPSSTNLAFNIARSISLDWKPGDEIVVTEMDHRCNVDPWLTAAKDRGVTVRWLEVDLKTLTLDLSNIESVINEKTVLVAAGLASNGIGTVNDAKRISKRAKEVGALFALDAVQAVPHMYVDRDHFDADILFCSTYKFFGPHLGAAVIKAELLDSLKAYKLACATDEIPFKLELGTQNHEAIAGIEPAVEFIASFGEGNSRNERIISGYKVLEEYENYLAEKLRNALKNIPRIKIHQASEDVTKTPTVSFTIEGINSGDAVRWIIENYSIFVAHGHFYASTLAEKLGINENGGWIRAGFEPYNTIEEVDLFIEAVMELLKK